MGVSSWTSDSTNALSRKPLQVLYIIDSMWAEGGAEMSLRRLLRALPTGRVEARIVTFHTDERARPFLATFPCPVFHWPLVNMYNREAWRVSGQIRDLIQSENIDIVHTFFGTSDLWAGAIAKLSGAPVLISSRRDMGILRQRKHRIGYRLLSGMFNEVHAVSDRVKQYVINHDRIDPIRIVTIRNGVDTGHHESVSERNKQLTRERAGIRPREVVIGTVANWRAVKGIDILVEAAALVLQSAAHVRFVIAGQFGQSPTDAAFTATVKQRARDLGIEKQMTFLGPCGYVPELLAVCDIFALPSRSEGLSNAILEAMQAALPCVATDVGGNPELIEHAATGYLVPAADPERFGRPPPHTRSRFRYARLHGSSRARTIADELHLRSHGGPGSRVV